MTDPFDSDNTPVFKFALREGLDDSFLPTRSSPTDTGWDVRATEDLLLVPGQHAKIDIGVRVLAPEGWWLELRPRSSSFAKHNLSFLYGVIDEGYENFIMIACQYSPANSGCEPIKIKKGDRLGQLIPVKRQEMKVEMLSAEEFNSLSKERKSSRGLGGFGSSGAK